MNYVITMTSESMHSFRQQTKMDRKKERRVFFSLPKSDPTSAYQSGTCDFCRQSEVKITPLHCKKHFYCRVCEEFAPKFQRRDYTCRVCSERARKLTNENLQRVDDFFKTTTGGGGKKDHFEEITFNIEGSKVIAFDEVSDDENGDFSGNNDEWEKLLQKLTKESLEEKKKPEIKRKTYTREIQFEKKDEQAPDLMDRNMSFLKLVLPSTEPPYRGSCEKMLSEECEKNPNCTPTRDSGRGNGLIEDTTLVPINQKDDLPSPDQSIPSLSQTSVKSRSSSDMERSTSPVKAVSGGKRVGWILPAHKDISDEDERSLSDEFSVIEGPGFRFSPDTNGNFHKNKEFEVDSFWDF